MQILCLCGSARINSSNHNLLLAIAKKYNQHQFLIFNKIKDFPIFQEGTSHSLVDDFRQEIRKADLIIISTPEYIHNVPAQLKNALEWVTDSGEFTTKKTIAITYTPHEPRGEKCMQSLLWSLKALDAQILCSLSLFKNKHQIDEDLNIIGEDIHDMLDELLS